MIGINKKIKVQNKTCRKLKCKTICRSIMEVILKSKDNNKNK
mgnify:CR=1 FL=1